MKITTYPDKGESKKYFNFDFNGHAVLSVDEIWPDGDAPENPTAEDVQKMIEGMYFSMGGFLSDWNLDDVISLNITGRD